MDLGDLISQLLACKEEGVVDESLIRDLQVGVGEGGGGVGRGARREALPDKVGWGGEQLRLELGF